MMREIGLAIAFVFLASTPARAELTISDRVFVGVLGGYVVAGGVDGYETWQCADVRRTCHEANRLLLPFVDHHGATKPVMIGKVGLQVGIAIALNELRKAGHRKEAAITLGGLFGAQLVVNYRNRRSGAWQ